MAPRTRGAVGLLVLILLAFVAHRVAVIYSAGDFIHELEPSEAKHTQIAWDLRTGRFGTDNHGLADYIANSGSAHHGSYFTCALAYVGVSLFTGFGMLGVRLTPLLFWAVGFGVLTWAMLRRFGGAAAVLTGLGLVFVPSQILELQVTFLGSHSETVLPLTAALAVWGAWLARSQGDEASDGGAPPWLTVLLGASLGYAVAFSYLLAPVAGLIVLITLLPPRPPLPVRTWVAGLAGVVLGMWPLWLIVALQPSALFGYSVTEDPSTTVTALAAGGGAGASEVLITLRQNLPSGAYDYWTQQATLPALWGDQHFEEWSWRWMVLAPLLLLPLTLTDADPVKRKVGTLIAVSPAVVYLFLGFATPWKPHIPVRYMIPMLVLAACGPAVAVGIGLPRRTKLGVATAAVFAVVAVWMWGPRAWEGMAAVRPARWGMNAEHRLVTYYNLGVGTVWAEDVRAVNDLVDVRSASGDPRSFDGVQAALWGGGATDGLGRGDWDPPEPMDWPALGSGIKEWRERQSFLDPADRDDPGQVAENIGWGLGIRTRWNPARVAAILDEAGDDWPAELDRARVWRGFGMGWGRNAPRRPATAGTLPLSIPADAREQVAEGMEQGRALGPAPEAPFPPVFPTVRGTAT